MRYHNYRNGLFGCLFIGWLWASIAVAAADKPITLRLGTLAPRGTSYHQSLLLMAEKWRQATDGLVRLTIFPDGSQGGEADTVGLMQTGNLDAGLLTAMGLAEIESDVNALQNMPMSFRNLDEVDYVGGKLRPQLEKRLLAKGYMTLFWSDSGWVRFFTKTPILYPDDLRKLRLYSWSGNPQQIDIYKTSGFNPVLMESTGIAQGLLSNTIEAVPMPPFFALAGQLNQQTKYMLELNWAPLVGALIVRAKSWERVPVQSRETMLKTAAEIGLQVKANGRAESENAVKAMVKRGLIVQQVSPEAEKRWQEAVQKAEHQIRGKIVPPEIYDEAQRLLLEYRAKAGDTIK